jgi:hypothetical protein
MLTAFRERPLIGDLLRAALADVAIFNAMNFTHGN